MGELHKPQVAILASGGGTTAEAFILATVSKRADLEVPLVISNNPDAGVFGRVKFLNKAHRLGAETLYISGRQYPLRRGEEATRGQTPWESEKICEALAARGIDHVALMGYMKIVTGDLLDEYGFQPVYDSIYQGRMSNTHPGPLPLTTDTAGVEAAKKVLAKGRKYSAHTVHLVSAGVDQGPIIAKHRVPVEPDDSPQALFARTQLVEKRELPTDIDQFLKDQAEWREQNS